mmetsp:Transcript_20583/g.52521  ORF Transcript_20583/g.52521 Transcript_20583/m.52521 type:complete len:343 (+) Transcript_20583:88-1116(+)
MARVSRITRPLRAAASAAIVAVAAAATVAVSVVATFATSLAAVVVVTDHRTPRLLVEGPLNSGARVELTPAQAKHVMTVLRAREGSALVLFDGESGEWSAELRRGIAGGSGKRSSRNGASGGSGVCAHVAEQLRPQRVETGPRLLFAPLKSKVLALLAEKATELGVSELVPVLTEHTEIDHTLGGEEGISNRIFIAACAAAEQCERLSVPVVQPLVTLERLLDEWPREVHKARTRDSDDAGFDAMAPVAPLLVALERNDERGVYAWPLLTAAMGLARRRLPDDALPAVLIGPEGGFTTEEADALAKHPAVVFVSLGPRILRAETAAFTALAVLQAVSDEAAA